MLQRKVIPWLLLISIAAAGDQPARKTPPCVCGMAAPSADASILPELSTQAKVFSIRLTPRDDEEWVSECLNLSLDQKKFGCRIIAYRIQWFSGSWSSWFVPGVNDLYKKPGEPLRRFWACFNDHSFEIIYQTPKDPVPFTGVKE